jgi:hypothetical protein
MAGYRLINRRRGIDVWKSRVNGKVVEVPCQRERTPLVIGASKEKPIAERMFKGYYDIECQRGSRFNSSFTKNEIKRIWSRPVPDVKED